MEKMIDRLTRQSRLKLLLLFFAISQISLITIDSLIFVIDPIAYDEYPSYQIEYFFSYPLIYSLVLYVLIGPIVETLIFQIFLLLTIKKLTKWVFNSDS